MRDCAMEVSIDASKSSGRYGFWRNPDGFRSANRSTTSCSLYPLDRMTVAAASLPYFATSWSVLQLEGGVGSQITPRNCWQSS